MSYQTLDTPLTTGELAKLCNADAWQVLAAIRRGFLPEPLRIGHFRLWTPSDVDRVVQALTAAGYLPRGHSSHSSHSRPAVEHL
jgi:DNA-binding MarR family transcriptional regulator